MLATRKMKNTMVCTLWARRALARITGRISSMAAPVVPTHDAMRVPISRNTVFSPGVPLKEPRIRMPPATVNRAQSRMMNGM